MVLGRSPQWHQGAIKAVAPVQKRGQAVRASLQPRAELARRMARRGATPRPDTVLMCDSVQDWLSEQCDHYRCMHVPRPQALRAQQQRVDLLNEVGACGPESSVQTRVQVAEMWGSEEWLAAEWSSKGRSLLDQVGGPGLPDGLRRQVQRDIQEVGMAMAKMLPDAKEMILKVELMGESVCHRWHQDYYTCRAIITYNGSGTVYAHNDNVNFWELRNCGNNDHIIRDASQVLSANFGDVLLMKGKWFPSTVNGLVHKSPDKRYHPDGSIMTRLCLEIDVA